jgi:hypothetical protein
MNKFLPAVVQMCKSYLSRHTGVCCDLLETLAQVFRQHEFNGIMQDVLPALMTIIRDESLQDSSAAGHLIANSTVAAAAAAAAAAAVEVGSFSHTAASSSGSGSGGGGYGSHSGKESSADKTQRKSKRHGHVLKGSGSTATAGSSSSSSTGDVATAASTGPDGRLLQRTGSILRLFANVRDSLGEQRDAVIPSVLSVMSRTDFASATRIQALKTAMRLVLTAPDLQEQVSSPFIHSNTLEHTRT